MIGKKRQSLILQWSTLHNYCYSSQSRESAVLSHYHSLLLLAVIKFIMMTTIAGFLTFSLNLF